MNLVTGNETLVSTIKNWYVLDIGFSSRKRSCGVFRTDEPKSKSILYGDVARDFADFAKNKKRIGLIIEAPLSYCFDARGNPCGRSFERRGKITRYWFNGLGCAVMTAALFFLSQLAKKQTDQEIILFEGFVSFKKKGTAHETDARNLFEARHEVLEPNQIALSDAVSLFGITSLFGGASEPPGVIICE